ncbi:MAG: protein BatD [Candidatus Latescibacteria bacterium]|nr:protein BatD [Candidatus Latescibacterota bacterium]
MTGKIKNNVIFFIIFMMCCFRTVFGADIQISSVVNSTKISINDRLILTITITGSDARQTGKPVLKNMPDFDVFEGGRSTKFQYINGATSYEISYTYTLIPKKTGTFEVGGAAVSDGSQNYGTNGIKVEIVSSPVQNQPSTNSEEQPVPDQPDANIFIKTYVDNNKPYVGEQITLTFELYNRLTLWGDTDYEPPSTTGFWAVALQKIPPSTKLYNNRMFQYNAIKTALFPTTSGEFTIGPALLTYNTGGFFSSQRSKVLRSNSIKVNARPLPEKGKPANFSGAVGKFDIAVSADKTDAKVGDVITVTITVTGNGNLDLISSIITPDLSAFKTYDPKVSATISNSGFIVGGAKIWEYVLMPKSPGEINLKPFTLSYFNPAENTYETVSTNTLNLKVTPGEFVDSDIISGGNRRNTIENIAQDIHYLKPDKITLGNAKKYVVSNQLYYLLYVLPFTLFSTAFIVKRRRDTIERNSGLKRKLNAWKTVQKRLNEASLLMSKNDRAAFYGKLSETITDFIGDRLNIDTGALTAGVLDDILSSNSVEKSLAERTRKTLELCDFFRFSSTGSGQEMQDKLLRNTIEILDKLKESL